LPAMLSHYVILAHFCGGFCLAVGLLTRSAAVVQLPALFTAMYFYVYHPEIAQSTMEARQSAEFTALVLFLLVLISVYGAGRLSVDHWLGKKDFAKLFHPEPHPTKS